jgi:predicted ATP-dependent endonuclease of OLD family
MEDQEQNKSKQILPSIDNISLGESILLNLFVNIIRHSGNYSKQLNEIKGIVAIDEIDVHLHTDLQNSVLPELIQLFPKIQFIITTHSPLFLLGMKKAFGEEGFEVRNMPKGDLITTERFSEFENAYNVLKETEKFEDEVKKQIVESKKTILFVEGDYDTRYLNKAGELLEKTKILKNIEIRDVVGYGNLDNIWKNFNNKTKLSEIVPQKIILLYDCDTNKQDNETEKVFKRVIPTAEDNIITKGIENLFDKTLLEKAIAIKKAYIDISYESRKLDRGKDIVVPEQWEINNDEKGNLCDWICQNGTKDDFKISKKSLKP